MCFATRLRRATAAPRTPCASASEQQRGLGGTCVGVVGQALAALPRPPCASCCRLRCHVGTGRRRVGASRARVLLRDRVDGHQARTRSPCLSGRELAAPRRDSAPRPGDERGLWGGARGCRLSLLVRPRFRARPHPAPLCPPCSMSVILFNKWLLAYSGFPFPLALTMCVTPLRHGHDAASPPPRSRARAAGVLCCWDSGAQPGLRRSSHSRRHNSCAAGTWYSAASSRSWLCAC